MSAKKLLNLWVNSPIDWWSGMIDLSKHSPRIFAMEYEDAVEFEARVHELLSAAKKLATEHGWEGDVSQGPYMAAIPSGDNRTDLLVAWKQSNNGTCFIASERLLFGCDFDQEVPHQAAY